MGSSSPANCGFGELLVFVGALVAGTGCSLLSKVLLSMKSIGADGSVESFQNPLFQTWGMFLGMASCLPIHIINERRKRRRGYAAIGQGEELKDVPRSTYFLLVIPAIFDLAATAFAMFGLTYITVSVYQMLRGGAIVFVAILKHFVIGDKLAGFMWVGVSLNVMSIVMVGATASGETGGEDEKNPLVGVCLILCGAVVQSLQYAFEEKVMSTGAGGAPPLLVITMEGVWGLLVCTFILYPACYALGIEDPRDTWVLIQNSKDIQIVFAFYFVAIFLYNSLAMLVTKMLNSVWHAILDNFRPITVWVTDLMLFYVFVPGRFGEPWAFPGSYIQLAALAVLLYGTAVYNGSVKLPGFTYPDDEVDDEATMASVLASPMLVRASPRLASPALLRSPLIHGSPSVRQEQNRRQRTQQLPVVQERSSFQVETRRPRSQSGGGGGFA